ncbi:DUF5665 domain-containing protein [Aestuariivita sp.]|uniref:DUF5665 domain-containing protein n=1 Tax=Aestuariivita sp. TaxID=1872407 RepID=UPI0021737E81|nr:DUF5665 domain-containing protein [Aestuariivita sp.]MCE8008419.1 hypothetical protein [Aestuariivita sp.]
MSDTIKEDLSALREELARLNNHRFIRLHDRPLRLLAFNFARGLAFGLGTVMGASLLLSVVVWTLSQIDFLPVIGHWASQIVQQIEQAR